jgi:hypothetical protein
MQRIALQRESALSPFNPANSIRQPCVRLFGQEAEDGDGYLRCQEQL